MTAIAKGIAIDVIRGLWDSTNGGISSDHDELSVVGVGHRGGQVIDELPTACRLVEPGSAPVALEIFNSSRGVYLSVVPVEAHNGRWKRLRPEGLVGPMYGGNEAYSTDSAWKQLLSDLGTEAGFGAVRIHDRFETVEQHQAFI